MIYLFKAMFFKCQGLVEHAFVKTRIDSVYFRIASIGGSFQ